jgi:hypothetical protein
MNVSTIDSSNENVNASIITLATINWRSECTFNEDSCISRIIWRWNVMRSQLENERVLNAYFRSSLVGYSAKLTEIAIVPQNIITENASSDLRDISVVNRGNLSNWERWHLQCQNTFHIVTWSQREWFPLLSRGQSDRDETKKFRK